MKGYLQRLFDSAAAVAPEQALLPAQRSQSPLVTLDQRLASSEFLGNFEFGGLGEAAPEPGPDAEGPIADPPRPKSGLLHVVDEGRLEPLVRPPAAPPPAPVVNSAVPANSATTRKTGEEQTPTPAKVPDALVELLPQPPSPTAKGDGAPAFRLISTPPVATERAPPPLVAAANRELERAPAGEALVPAVPASRERHSRAPAIPDAGPARTITLAAEAQSAEAPPRRADRAAPQPLQPALPPLPEPLPPPARALEWQDIAPRVEALVRKGLFQQSGRGMEIHAPEAQTEAARNLEVPHPATANSVSVIGPIERPSRHVMLFGSRLR